MARAKEMGVIVTDAEGKEKVKALLPLKFEPDNKGTSFWTGGYVGWEHMPRNTDVSSPDFGQFETGVVVRFGDVGLGMRRAGFSAVIAAEPFRKDGKLLLPLLADSSDSDGRPMLFYWAMEEDGFPNWLGVFEVRGGTWWSPEGIVAHATPNSRGRYVTQEWSPTNPTEVLDEFAPGQQLVMDIAGGASLGAAWCDQELPVGLTRADCRGNLALYERYRLANDHLIGELINGKRSLRSEIVHASFNLAVAVPGE